MKPSPDKQHGLAFDFYNTSDPSRWGRDEMPEDATRVTAEWLSHANPKGPVVEIGCGKGALARASENYIGSDLSLTALARGTFRRVAADMEQLPFVSGCAEFVFSWAALEHVPAPEKALEEMARIVAPNGILLLAPAWHCRPWAAEGLAFRSWSELRTTQRLRKLTIPLRDSILWRGLFELPRRVIREIEAMTGHPVRFDYRKLRPNLETYVGTDCDAFSSMDPHAAIMFFVTRGWRILSHPGRKQRFLSRHEPVVVQRSAE